MNIFELLAMMRLLSALESWGNATSNHIPDYLQEQLTDGVSVLERDIIKHTIK